MKFHYSHIMMLKVSYNDDNKYDDDGDYDDDDDDEDDDDDSRRLITSC